MPHRKFFDQATITAAKLITISNCFWQFIIAIIFWWEILDEMIIRLLAIFLWLIGREYFGKRFWLQLLPDWWQYLCDWLVGNILVATNIRLMRIFLWVIGGEYFGKRFCSQLLSNWWRYLCEWLVGNIMGSVWWQHSYQIGGNLQCRKFNCSSCRCLYCIEIFVVVLSLIYPNIILQRQSYVIKFGYYYAHTLALSKIRHR